MGNQNPIIDLFCEIASGIEIVNCNVYNEEGLEFIYHKDGKWIFFQDVKNGKFWCSNARYWTLFTSKFDLSYEEIQAITKYLVEEALKNEVSTPQYNLPSNSLMVDEALKKEVSTPHVHWLKTQLTVEEALKEKLRPNNCDYRHENKVQDALKQELGTPIGNFYIEPNLVQEELSTPTYADGTIPLWYNR